MKNFVIPAAFILFGSSCQKVIKVDLNDANPQYVIEARMHEGTNNVVVVVSKTSSYFSGSDSMPPVNNATVTLSDGIHPTQTAALTFDGVYEIPNYTAVANQSYRLTVTVDGKVFTSDAYMPVSPVFDSLDYVKFSGGFGPPGIDPYLVTAHFKDSIGIRNYYRILVTKNGELQNQPFDLYLLDDQVRDGLYFDVPVFTAFCDVNDSMDIQMLSMDEHVYDYFLTLGDILTGDVNNSAAPANPNTNIRGGALGYFAAYSSTTKSVRIK